MAVLAGFAPRPDSAEISSASLYVYSPGGGAVNVSSPPGHLGARAC